MLPAKDNAARLPTRAFAAFTDRSARGAVRDGGGRLTPGAIRGLGAARDSFALLRCGVARAIGRCFTIPLQRHALRAPLDIAAIALAIDPARMVGVRGAIHALAAAVPEDRAGGAPLVLSLLFAIPVIRRHLAPDLNAGAAPQLEAVAANAGSTSAD